MKKTPILRGRRKLITLGLTSFAVLALTAGTMISMALFTDTETVDNTFTTGTIILDATRINALDLTTSDLMPGDALRSPVTVENDGTAELRYAVSQTSTNLDGLDLHDALLLVIRNADTGAGAFGTDGDYCDDANGTELRASAAMGTSGNLVGDPAQGSDTGDRTLASGASEVLCFYVSLGIGAPNLLQGALTTTTFSFAAEQTANNN